MPNSLFRAMVVEETADHRFLRHIKDKSISDLPDGDVLIKVQYSSLNYKDALSANGNKGVTRRYPHTPGVDAAGEVAESRNDLFSVGDAVVVTGYDLGMNTSGGFGQFIRVPAQWVVPLPVGLTLKESMIFGTAGFTAAVSLYKLMNAGVKPEDGDILVTGASGGVGTISVALLAHCGYSVVAASGKPQAKSLLKTLGAAHVVGREAVSNDSGKPLLINRWAGAIDTVGGEILSHALRSTLPHGAVSTCGNVASAELHLTVYPFILRGISLMGVASAASPMELRRIIWQKLSGPWKISHLERIVSYIGLEDLNEHIDKILAGKQIGRKVIDLNA